MRRLVFRENKAVHVAPLWEPRPRGERRSSVQKSFAPGSGLPQKQSSARLSHCGNRDPAANGAARCKKASPRGRASHKNKAVHVAPLWEPRPRGERRSSVLKKLRPGGGPPTTAIVGAATPRRTAQPGAEKASARGRASHESRLAAVAGINPPISLVGARALADPQPRFQARLSPAPALQPFHSAARPWPVADAAGERPELAWPGGSSEIRSRPH